MYDQLRQETKNQNIRRSAQPGTDVDYDLTTEALRPISQKRTMKTGLVFKCGFEKNKPVMPYKCVGIGMDEVLHDTYNRWYASWFC